MTEVHKVICEKCGKEADMKRHSWGYLLPRKWKYYYEKDICPDCMSKLKKVVDKIFFMEKK